MARSDVHTVFVLKGSVMKPTTKPQNPNFSSGPCSKRPGHSLSALQDALLGRSHRAKGPKAKLKDVIERSKAILKLPKDWRLGIVPASDTGAVEMTMWSMLGPRGVDVLVWESFSKGWAHDIKAQLKLDNYRVLDADYGSLPDLNALNFDNDVVFVFNGTTSGVRLENLDFIDDNRKGLTICDATSAAFAMNIDYQKLDVVTWSWQKVMGGEAAHGMLALSPRAVERLESHTPPWPMPKIFRMTKSGKLNEAIFEGSTINTPSMLAVEDALDGLKWAESLGGLETLVKRCDNNLSALASWVERTEGIEFLAKEKAQRSSTSMCLSITADWFVKLDAAEQKKAATQVATLLDDEGVAFDIKSYKEAPPGLRIWGGATIETSDIEALCPWLDWSLSEVSKQYA